MAVNPLDLLPASCQAYLNKQDYLQSADAAKFDSNSGASILIGADQCQADLADTVKTAWATFKTAAASDASKYTAIGKTED